MTHVTQYVRDFETRRNLNDLEGTEAQVAWARTIRCQFIMEVEAIDRCHTACLFSIRKATTFIEDIRPFIGNAHKWIDKRTEKKRRAAMTPAECRAELWHKAEAHKDRYPGFDLIDFMRFVKEKDDKWVRRAVGKTIAQLNKGRHWQRRMTEVAVSDAA